ncbi:TetR family transcriptional regulator [Nonomuraea sp. K274]|uniref:TetR family transcriptional regulator n=2 Tax=Nonomuraea cypriaca TaxID=1187855 RepID=A0A931EZ90_9ACTN|nr:TetR family transcriptional regulator [Nonomuraea cypriaca]
MVGLRERKKERTRQALIEAALRLFAEQGYEETTLAQIAAEADVSTRTFFSYFASKEDVVFHDGPDRTKRAVALLAARRPDESPTELLLRLLEESVTWAAADGDLTFEDAALRVRLILTEPALQARGLQLLFDSQLAIARALHEAFPGRLSQVDAAAAVGALLGAVKLAVIADIQNERSLEQVWVTVRRAADLALSGLRSID